MDQLKEEVRRKDTRGVKYSGSVADTGREEDLALDRKLFLNIILKQFIWFIAIKKNPSKCTTFWDPKHGLHQMLFHI